MTKKQLTPIRLKVRLLVDGEVYDTDVIGGLAETDDHKALNDIVLTYYMKTIHHFQDDLGKKCTIDYTVEKVNK